VSADHQPFRNVSSDYQMGNRTEPNENSHLWVLINLLATLKEGPTSQLMLHFLKYVIAASHQKMKRRFESLSSEQNWSCFESLKPEDIHVQPSSGRPRLPIELQNDLDFLSILGEGIVVPDYKNLYPNIAAIILEGPPPYATTSWSELFNDTTCKEYHTLFIALVRQFRNLVNEIAAFAKDKKSLEDKLDPAVKTGHTLLTMVKGRAFHLYLSTIAPKLASQHSILLSNDALTERDAQGCNNKDCDNDKGEDNEGGDAEGTSLWEPGEADAVTALWVLWRPFKSWVMLILVQLEAANALCDFITKSDLSKAQIDVKLVYGSLVSDQTIPLEELLQKQHIPPGLGDRNTNADLLNFVITAKTLKTHVERLRELKGKWDPIEGKGFLDDVLGEARKQHQEDSDQGGDPTNAAISILSAEIIEQLPMLQVADILAKIAVLEGLLKERQARYDLPFREKPSFKGAIHCEVALASILDKSTRQRIKDQIEKRNMLSSRKRSKSDNKLYDNLSELLAETEVSVFSIQLVPRDNFCSIHDGRASHESSGYRNVAAQCATFFLLIYQRMPRSTASSRQVFTTPSRVAPYQHGPQNRSWIP
jgi:hypothetical protein